MRPSRKKSSEKIDGIVSVIMALGRAMLDNDSGGSVYATRGVIEL
jgi:phage terminase large subunit-like protein